MTRDKAVDGVFIGLGFAALLGSAWMFVGSSGSTMDCDDANPTEARMNMLEERITALQGGSNSADVIGFIDLREAVLADKTFMKEREKLRAEALEKQKSLREAFVPRFEEANATLRTTTVGEEEWRTASRKLLAARIDELEQETKAEQTLLRKNQDLMVDVDVRVRDAVALVCREQGITLILNVFHADDGDESEQNISQRIMAEAVVFPRSSGRDITKRVIEIINKDVK